ncbi:glycosyltransferase, partial [Paenibacillus oceani]
MIKASYFFENVDIYKTHNLIEKPIISVILPTFCRGNNGLLKRAIDSVINQSFKEWELIIVDDGSIDKTRQVVESYLNNENRIIYIRNNINSSLPALRVNQGIMHARGDYIAYQFDDDLWFNNALQDLYNEIIKLDTPSLVYGKCQFIDVISKEEIVFGENFNFNQLHLTNLIANNTVLHSKELPFRYGGYDCHVVMKRLCDWDLWLRWAEVVPFVHVDSIVSCVEANQEGSLGRTSLFDSLIIRYMQNVNRANILGIDRIKEYVVDDLSMFNKDSLKEMIYREHIMPWSSKKIEFMNVKEFSRLPIKKENIVVLIDGYNATTNITLTNFFSLLNERYNVLFVTIYNLDHRIFEYADVLILQRFSYVTPEIHNLCANIPTIYLMDDNLLKLYTLGNNYMQYAPNTEAYSVIANYIKSSNLILTTNSGISNDVKAINENTFEISTNILEKYIPEKLVIRNQDKLKIAWIGYNSRKEELDIFESDIRRICTEFENVIEFYFFGSSEELCEKFPYENCFLIPHVSDYYKYIEKLKEYQFNFVISLIENTEFKNCKSPIKFLEITAAGAVGIYSNEIVYHKVKDKKNGFLIENKSGNLYKKIKEVMLVDKLELNEIFDRAREDILSTYTTEVNKDLFILMIELAKFNYYLKDNRKIGFIINENISS